MSTFCKIAQQLAIWAFDDYVAGLNLFTDSMGYSYFLDHVPSGGNHMTHYETLEELITAVQELTGATRADIMANIAFENVDKIKQFIDEVK